MKATPTVNDLMQLRKNIDQELHQRLNQKICLLFADVVGSSAFFQKHGDMQGRFFVQRHHDLLSPLIAQYKGRVIKTIGDALMASFEAPENAFDCAVAMHHTLWEAQARGGEDKVPLTKVCLHYGPALVEANDVYGDLVNTSARLLAMAAANQILISQTVYDLVHGSKDFPMLPLSTFGWKEGEKSIPVYEVLWRQQAEAEGKAAVFRTFEGGFRGCFYCGSPEHPVRQCPSKQLTGVTHRLEQLGYQPMAQILRLFQQQDLNAIAEGQAKESAVFEAFYEIALPYQLRFVQKIWLATVNEDWGSLVRQQLMTSHALIGTRLWTGLDCLRVGRYDQAKEFLQSTVDSNPGDYKPHVALGFLALEKDDAFRALQHWRKGLALTKTALQSAYLHLLIHRLYDMNGKTQMAYQELQKALGKDRYLHEARYRQMALLVKEGTTDDLLPRLRKLIQDDRSVYVKVMLDPAFATCREQFHPLLTSLCQDARTEALACLPQVTKDLSALREWYPQPEEEILAIERSFDRLNQHIKSESYFGYHDASHDGAALQTNIGRVLERRKKFLQREYTLALNTIEERLTALSHRAVLAQQPHIAGRIHPLLTECARCKSVTSFQTAAEFWRAWEEMQQLKAALQDLEHALAPGRSGSHAPRHFLRSLLLYALAGGAVVDTTLFGILGYLVYFSDLQVSEGTLLWSLVWGGLGGLLLGSAAGWGLQQYQARR